MFVYGVRYDMKMRADGDSERQGDFVAKNVRSDAVATVHAASGLQAFCGKAEPYGNQFFRQHVRNDKVHETNLLSDIKVLIYYSTVPFEKKVFYKIFASFFEKGLLFLRTLI